MDSHELATFSSEVSERERWRKRVKKNSIQFVGGPNKNRRQTDNTVDAGFFSLNFSFKNALWITSHTIEFHQYETCFSTFWNTTQWNAGLDCCSWPNTRLWSRYQKKNSHCMSYVKGMKGISVWFVCDQDTRSFHHKQCNAITHIVVTWESCATAAQ